ncbi:hypothetical protein [Cohnella massiliensis]|nr:hypothetical protein [Cohnella massiliensis]
MNLTEYIKQLLNIPEEEPFQLELEPAFRFELPLPEREEDDGDA